MQHFSIFFCLNFSNFEWVLVFVVDEGGEGVEDVAILDLIMGA